MLYTKKIVSVLMFRTVSDLSLLEVGGSVENGDSMFDWNHICLGRGIVLLGIHNWPIGVRPAKSLRSRIGLL